MSERFDRVLKMSLDYDEIELMDMLDFNLVNGTPFERSIEVAIALMLNRINEFNRQIEEVKQCLKPKEKPITMDIFYPKGGKERQCLK